MMNKKIVMLAVCICLVSIATFHTLPKNCQHEKKRGMLDIRPYPMIPNFGRAVAEFRMRAESLRRFGTNLRDFSNISLSDMLLSSVPEKAKKEWIEAYGGYDFFYTGDTWDNYHIRIVSKCMGRNYIYDPRTSVFRLEFESAQERAYLGRYIKLFYEQKLTTGQVSALFMAIPYPEGLCGNCEDLSFPTEFLGYFGDFLLVPDLQDFVLSVAFDGRDHERLNCLRGICSVIPLLPADIKSRVHDGVMARLRSIANGNISIDKFERAELEKLLLAN